MTDLNQAAESEIRDTEIETNEIVEETLEEASPENKDAVTEPEAIASVDKAPMLLQRLPHQKLKQA